MSAARPRLVLVGAGPRTVGLLERLAASASDLLPASLRPEIHVVDEHPPGGGRIWRTAQSPLLWMNSTAADVTVFTDESVVCAGPVVPGPSLAEWVRGQGREILAAAGLDTAIGPDDFASRDAQGRYLAWALARAVDALPPGVTVAEHRARAIDVRDGPGRRQSVTLADGTVLAADVVVLAQGYLDCTPTPAEAGMATRAAEFGLTYIPPGYTADVDLSGLRPGEQVIVRGFGLAFIDAMVLLGEGRGGRFVTRPDGTLRYRPSGAEPVLHVGSRRGVPYHAKLGYGSGVGPVPPRYLTVPVLQAHGPGEVDFRTVVWPLVVKELTAAHYARLFLAHTERTTVSWEDFSAVLDAADVLAPAFAQFVEQSVPKAEDRFDIRSIDRPLRDRTFADHDALDAALRDYVEADLARRADPYHSADRAVFDALITVYGVLATAITIGLIGSRDRIRAIEGDFHGLFSFLASGPPPRRLRELLALHEAGLVRFAGPDLRVGIADDGTGRLFEARSPAVPTPIRARALLDAWLPRPDVRAATDPIIRGLLAAGELAAEDLADDDGSRLPGGQLLADRHCRAVRSDRSVHPRRFLLGPSVSGSAGSAGFARPGFNGAGLRQNDTVARHILRLLAGTPDPATEPGAAPRTGPGSAEARAVDHDGSQP